MKKCYKPLLLLILDGWGYREERDYNAILAADTPHWDRLWQDCPHMLITGSGESVGLPKGQMGNSEVGHLNMGAGRIIYQNYTRIEQAIQRKDFFENQALVNAVNCAKQYNKAIHIMGLLSPGGVHCHEQQIHAMIKLACQKGANNVYLHAFLDGRDRPPQSALSSLQAVEHLFQTLGCGQVTSIIGRYYAMDRDKRWDRIQAAYELLTEGNADYHAVTPMDALQMAYRRKETDEFVNATTIHANGQTPLTVQEGDVVIFMNYRADRARELTRAFVDDDFPHFVRKVRPKLATFVTLTQYAKGLKTEVAFPPETIHNGLGEYLSKKGLPQLRLAETEKYAHVTFFFNGGIEAPFPGEERILIPSPKVLTYDLQPEMSAIEVTDQLIKAITMQQYAVIICNYANPDMVGHSGNFDATVKAIETIDSCLGRIVDALKKVGGEAIITADHGNAELMFDEHTMQSHTAHTNQPIPFIYVGRSATMSRQSGSLSDVAPTLLHLLNLPQPEEMTGKSLLELM